MGFYIIYQLRVTKMEQNQTIQYYDASNNEDIHKMSTTLNLNDISSIDDVFKYAESLNYGEVHFKMDKSTGLFAIIAIHSTKLGPAIGGCRFISYPSVTDAAIDVLRLAHMMSYKAAICNLPHGGAKAVLMKPAHISDRNAYFKSYAKFVDELNGRYVTAIDSGTDVNDMDLISQYTPYVTCTSKSGSDPSPHTALGVRRGIEAAVKHKLGANDLKGIHVAIQGAGHVGYYLTQQLVELGAKVTVADTNLKKVQGLVDEFGVHTTTTDKIYSIECDVFAPCALGAVLNSQTIPQLRASIVAGSANNQLANMKHDDQLLFDRGILYAPDFLINAGGLIQAATYYDHEDTDKAEQQILSLYDSIMDLFKRAEKENKPTHLIAQLIAEERLTS